MNSLNWTRRIMGVAALWSALNLVACGGGGATDSATPSVGTGMATVLAGSLRGAGSADGAGLAAQFSSLDGIAQDSAGNTYLADGTALRKMTPDGTVSTLAGSLDQTGGADGEGTSARFMELAGVALDGAGNVYVTDIGNHTVRKITAAGVVTTLAGRAGEVGAADGIGDAARFRSPAGLAIDRQGNLYVVDSNNHTVRKITPQGAVSTFAGAAGEADSVAGDGAAARFAWPQAVTLDGDGNVYVSEPGNQSVVRKLSPTGRAMAWGAARDGMLRDVGFPRGLAADAQGNVYVASGGFVSWGPSTTAVFSAVKRITSDGTVQHVAGDNELGSVDGPAAQARFNRPQGIALGSQGRVVVADTGNFAIRQIDVQGVVSTLAGGCGRPGFVAATERCGVGYVDAQGSAARFFNPQSLTASPDGTLYVADRSNRVVRRVGLDARVSTLRGADDQPLTFYAPFFVQSDAAGKLWIGGLRSHWNLFESLTVVDAAGGSTPVNWDHCLPPLALDGEGNCYFLWGGPEIRVGSMSDVSRVWSQGISCSSDCRYVSAPGVLYVADTRARTLTALASEGTVKWVTGTAGASGRIDGPATAALFEEPTHLTVDPEGNVYVVDGSVIRKVSPEGAVRTVFDLTGKLSAPGTPVPQALNQMNGLVWSKGALYALVLHAVVKISLPGN